MSAQAIVALAFSRTERTVIATALEEFVDHHGESEVAQSVLQMLEAPLEPGELIQFEPEGAPA